MAGVAAIIMLAACSSDTTSSNRNPVQLSFTTKASATTTANLASDVTVGAPGGLAIHRIRLVFGKIELDQAGNADCVGEVEREDDDHVRGDRSAECEDVKRDPLLVDLLPDDAPQAVITVPLSAGTFRQLEAKLEPARDRFTAFNAANPDLVGKSVVIEGTMGSTPFTFTSAVRSNIEMEFDPPLVIDETTKNATISLDVRKWFLTPSGAVIDPTHLTSDQQAQIESNIRRSFHAFEDDNELGEDHHEGHHGNDDGR